MNDSLSRLKSAVSILPILILLLFLVMPFTYSLDWLYIAIGSAVILIFILWLVLYFKLFKIDKTEALSCWRGNRKLNIFILILSVVGLILYYFTDNMSSSFIWWLCLVGSVLELILPGRLKNK